MTTGEKERYSRQILFSPIGEAGQATIRKTTAAVIGCGALGTFQAEALARAGVARLKLIDRDYVDFSNLQRQWLYDESDAQNESPKAIAAARRLHQLNRDVQLETHVADLTPSNAEDLLTGSDLIFDGTDNFETRYLLNDISIKLGIPWIYGAAVGSYGIAMPIVPEKGPCFACVYPEAPRSVQPTCDVNGVLASVTASIAAIQVSLGIRLAVGWEDFSCRIQTLDIWTGQSNSVNAGQRDPDCATCGKRHFKYLEGQKAVPVSLCGRNAVQLHESARPLNLQDLAARLERLGRVRVNDFALRVTLPKYDFTIFPDGRAIVKGTTDIGLARSVYAHLIGA